MINGDLYGNALYTRAESRAPDKKFNVMMKSGLCEGFPNLTIVARKALVRPGSNADSEKGFNIPTIMTAIPQKRNLHAATVISIATLKATKESVKDTDIVPDLPRYHTFEKDYDANHDIVLGDDSSGPESSEAEESGSDSDEDE